jgi:hypothetical protein
VLTTRNQAAVLQLRDWAGRLPVSSPRRRRLTPTKTDPLIKLASAPTLLDVASITALCLETPAFTLWTPGLTQMQTAHMSAARADYQRL